MKINFIVNQEDQNSELDANILSFLFKKIKYTTDIKLVNVNNFKCDNASINFFLGTMNNVLTKYAKFNIFVPNSHVFKRQELVLLDNFDYVLCKSKYTKVMFENHVSKEKLKFISWRSTDMNSNTDKDYSQFMLYCYDKNYTQYKKIIEAWKDNYPTLNIVGFSEFKKADNIKYHVNIKQNDFEKLFNNCGFHICCNETDTFSHNINQCALVKSVPIIINSAPMNEIISSDNMYTLQGKKKKLATFLGNKTVFSESSFQSNIESIMKITDETLFDNMGSRGRSDALKNHSINDSIFKETIKEIFDNVRRTPKNKPDIIKEYPKISLVTLVHNRKEFFNLSVYNYNTNEYPKDKIEWIVYDTSKDEQSVEKLLPPIEEREKQNIKYIHNNTIMSIGETRNQAVLSCSNDIVIFNDDDDFYYPKNIMKRVEELLHSGKKIVGCTILGCFNINKCISFIESNPITNNIQDRVSVATLGFYKSCWENTKFLDESIGEAHDFILNNLNEFHEISWEDVIVSLVHRYNTTNRITPDTQPNGNHYGFSKGLFKYLTELQNT